MPRCRHRWFPMRRAGSCCCDLCGVVRIVKMQLSNGEGETTTFFYRPAQVALAVLAEQSLLSLKPYHTRVRRTRPFTPSWRTP